LTLIIAGLVVSNSPSKFAGATMDRIPQPTRHFSYLGEPQRKLND
jgi:hypothetical protein